MSQKRIKTPMPAPIPQEQREQMELTPLTPDEFTAFKKSFDDSKKTMHPDVRMGISRLITTVEFTISALSQTMGEMVAMMSEQEIEPDSPKD